MWFTFSRRTALIIGILLPLGETIRRWGTWFADPPAYLDDVSIGAFLLVAAWLSARKPDVGQRWLAAAWGYTVGVGYGSVFGHLSRLGEPDVSRLPHIAVFCIIAVGWLVAIVALVAALVAPLGLEPRTSSL